ncbi:MAG: GAF domain-containing sensor histidine kinase [Gracilimonas sp.]|uniref:GAF domain-containing sensor histidine kinase n=1 Tax=Gracilimonas TaxID=649462 RepID=UPI001B1905F7|nr:GAF domain-containing sensor histidine kinase [Gracilimonas sp.]MBO6584571.1 GAF domain-containing sensor histidine kinase [Gracilimonas sp.]MBO6616158.1 GAF domain-containing sensor histidine kinase [Gracilimonas sp.]
MSEIIEQKIVSDYPVPENESERQKEVEKYDILDTLPEEEFDSLVELAAIVTESSMSQMNILDHNRQWTKSAHGLESGTNCDRSEAVCAHTILADGSMEITDLSKDDRFKNASFVQRDPHHRFYSGYPLKTKDGFNIGALCVLDSTPKELNETQRRALKTIAREIVSRLEIRRTQIKLEKLNREKNHFLRVVNHDIKSPLSGIVSTAHYLQNVWDGDHDELKSMLSMIEISGRKLVTYTSELVSNSLEEGDSRLIVDEVQVDELIKDLILIYTPLAKTKQVDITTNFNISDSFELDNEKFKLIVSNLISNALKFSSAGDTITVKAEIVDTKENRILHCSVSDTGIGIPEQYMDGLFTQNEKHRRSGTQGEISTGLGLPLVKQFVELHGGGVKVETEEGVGSTFYVTIPEKQ